MSVTVRVPYKFSQTMPNICVCCGAPNPKQYFHVYQSHYVSSLSTKFPLCDRCNSLIKKRKSSCFVLIISIIIFISLLFLLKNFFRDDEYVTKLLISFSLSIVAYIVLKHFTIQIGREGLSQEEIQLQEKAIHAVKIIWYFSRVSTTFKFENESYGTFFARLNGGKIIRSG